jgi:hypothetical protein
MLPSNKDGRREASADQCKMPIPDDNWEGHILQGLQEQDWKETPVRNKMLHAQGFMLQL